MGDESQIGVSTGEAAQAATDAARSAAAAADTDRGNAERFAPWAV